jgi:cyclopropane fatty-acyl-phospholipid synthase-like methyltransferase
MMERERTVIMQSRATTAIPGFVPRDSWEEEFGVIRAIPSSGRAQPAKALVLFAEVLGLQSPTKVLDVGAGNGRNTIYLANRGCRVTALDFSEVALKEIRQKINDAGVSDRVAVVTHHLPDPTPFSEQSFDFVLDAYVSCHFLRDDVRTGFWKDMARITRRDGRLLSVVFALEDEYYSRLLKNSFGDSVVCDPVNGIWKRLYSENQIKEFFLQQFQLEYFAKFEFPDRVLGETYRRVVFTSVLKPDI